MTEINNVRERIQVALDVVEKLLPGWELWWLSYADDAGSKGVVLVAGESFLHACQRSHSLNLSPGGEVCGFAVPAGPWLDCCWPHRDKLSTRTELEALRLAMPEGWQPGVAP